MSQVKAVEADIYEKAAFLLIEIVRLHPFSSGNRRTAYARLNYFSELMGGGVG